MSIVDAAFFGSLPASDIERASHWYEDKLGLRPTADLGPAGLLYQTGGTRWLLYQTPSAGTGKHTLGGWVVPNIDDAVADLRGKGVVFEEYALGDAGPNTVNGVARDPSGGAIAWFKDSEDNVLALSEMPPGMAMPG
jgi:catechol 2,3-dioxygenase-like lactoylglutathione lyase family enzyme